MAYKTRILITGASGFVGQHLTNYFHEKSYEVFAHLGHKGLDLTEERNAWGLPPNVDVLIHAAANSPRPGVSLHDITSNITITENLLTWAKYRGYVKKIIFFSSVSMYGEVKGGLLTEHSPRINPNLYGETKHICEELLIASGIPTMSLELPAIVGKGAKHNWPARLAQAGKAGEHVRIFNINGRYNNVVHIKFLCELIEKLIENGWPGPKFVPLLVASDGSLSLRNAAEMLTGNSSLIEDHGYQPERYFLIDIGRLAKFMKPWHTSQTITRYVEDER